jgi:hypothetical protein
MSDKYIADQLVNREPSTSELGTRFTARQTTSTLFASFRASFRMTAIGSGGHPSFICHSTGCAIRDGCQSVGGFILGDSGGGSQDG